MRYIRACDAFLAVLAESAEHVSASLAGQAPAIRAARTAAFMELRGHVPDEAEYWAPENQARIWKLDRQLTPERCAQALAAVREDDARLEADPKALEDARAEEALWETTVADGLDTA